MPARPTRSRILRVGLAVCLIAIGAAAATLVAHGSRAHAAPARAVPLGTATVRRGDLIATQRYTGQLSYAARGSVHLGGAGTVTSLPHAGQVLADGDVIAGVDDRPIGVLFGATPLYRTLGSTDPAGARLAVGAARADLLAAQATLAQATRPAHAGRGGSPARAAAVAQAGVGVDEAQERLLASQQALRRAETPLSGPDVALVAGDMAALGDGRGFTDTWDASLQAAVARWQEHLGAAPTGTVDPDDVVVLRGPARVTGVQGAPGDSPSAVTISLSSPTRVATFHLRGDVPAALSRGRRVRLSAGNATGTGRVTSVIIGGQTSTVQVAFPSSSALAHTAANRVAMRVVTADRRDVLTVPTQALLALASGGYALQLPGGRLLPVRTGTVQDGDIEVSGAGVHGGLRVVSVT